MKIFAVACLTLLSLNTYAVNPTQGPLQQDPSLCSYGYNPNCNQDSSPSPQKIIRHITVNVPSKYGALALNTNTGIVSGVLNRDSEAEAKKAAIQQCKAHSPKASCKLAGMVRNGCLAAASGKRGKTWSLYKAAEKPGLTEQLAMRKCKADGAKECKIIMPEGCSLPDTSQY